MIEELDFILSQNNKSIHYKYFGNLIIGSMHSGIDFDCPDNPTRLNWYSQLKATDICMASAILGVIYNYQLESSEDDFKDIYGEELLPIFQSKEVFNFINKWFECDGILFNEPYFLDGHYGNYSRQFDNYADNSDENDGVNKSWTWAGDSITISFKQECDYGEWHDKIYIDASLEEEFTSEFTAIIELFNT